MVSSVATGSRKGSAYLAFQRTTACIDERERAYDPRGDPQAAVRLLADGPADLQGAEDPEPPREDEQQQLHVAPAGLLAGGDAHGGHHVRGHAHCTVPGQPAGGMRVWHSAARLCSSAMMR